MRNTGMAPAGVADSPISWSTSARRAGSRRHRRRPTERAGPRGRREVAQRWAPPWWTVFVVGLLLWGATFAVARVTRNVILLPTIVLLGSFLVPVTAVVWYLDHDTSPALSPRRILAAFIIAGVFGVLGASLLEYWLVSAGILGSLEVGLIEEAVKGIFIAIVALGVRPFHVRDGMVLGAT